MTHPIHLFEEAFHMPFGMGRVGRGAHLCAVPPQYLTLWLWDSIFGILEGRKSALSTFRCGPSLPQRPWGNCCHGTASKCFVSALHRSAGRTLDELCPPQLSARSPAINYPFAKILGYVKPAPSHDLGCMQLWGLTEWACSA